MTKPRDYPDRPFVGVGAVILEADRVLLVKRGKPPRDKEWSLPGGAQDVGETVDACLRREVREETNLEVSIRALIDVIDGIFTDDSGRVQYHYTMIDYLAERRSGEPEAGDDVSDVAWFRLDELDGLAIWSETRRVIARAHSLLQRGGRGT